MTNLNEHSPKKLKIWLPLLFSLVLVLGMLIGVNLKQTPVVASKEKIPIIRKILSLELPVTSSRPIYIDRCEDNTVDTVRTFWVYIYVLYYSPKKQILIHYTFHQKTDRHTQ